MNKRLEDSTSLVNKGQTFLGGLATRRARARRDACINEVVGPSFRV